MFKLLSKKDKPMTVELNISNRTVVRVLLLVVVTMLGLAALRTAAPALTLIFIAFFLALALNAPVHWLAQRLPGKGKGSRAAATAISFLVVVLAMAGFFASIVPPLVRQTNSFIESAPHLIEQAKREDTNIGKFVYRYNLESQVQNISDELNSRLKSVSSAGGAALSTVKTIGGSVFSVLTILVLTFMMLVEGPKWIRVFQDLIPDDQQERSQRLAGGMYRVVKGYVNGQVILAALAAVLILPVMIVLDISYPVALMVIVFICGLIPMVGHTIGAVIVSLIALFTSPAAAIIILAYYILYQQIENYVVQPRVQANTTDMSPLLVFVSVIIGVNFGGVLGGLVAIPVAGCIRIAVLEYLRSKHMIGEARHVQAATKEA